MFRSGRLRVVAVLAALSVPLTACGDDGGADTTADTAAPSTVARTPSTGSSTATAAGPQPLPGLPADTAGFQDWLRVDVPAESTAPHGDVKAVYWNRERSEITGRGPEVPYPDGTIVVKTGSRGDDLAAVVAVMNKRTDADPQHGDWVFVEYTRSSPDEPYEVLAQDSICWGCHVGAEKTDWVFTKPD